MFNPVAPYQYRLPTVYLFMANITNPGLFVCSCWTWICFDITRFYEEQRQQKKRKSTHMAGARGLNTICRDSSTACRLCHLEPATTSSTSLFHHQVSLCRGGSFVIPHTCKCQIFNFIECLLLWNNREHGCICNYISNKLISIIISN